MQSTAVIIIGTGREARLAAEYLMEQDYVIYGFLSEKVDYEETEILDIPVLGYYEEKTYLQMLKDHKVDYFNAITDSEIRRKATQQLFEASKRHPMSVIHTTACIAGSASLAGGIMVGPFSYIGSYSSVEADTFIGSHVSIGSHVKIDRGCQLQSGVRVGDQVVLENHVYIGLGAVVNNGIRVGEQATIAPGSVVLEQVPAKAQVIGNPAKKI